MISKYSNQKKKINEKEIEEAALEIRKGNLVLFPTETVYGIGANALDLDAVKKIFVVKKRAQDNPLIVHVCGLKMVEEIVEEIGELEKKLIKKFWPGPLTIIMKRKSEKAVPNIVTAGLDTVGVRMPDNEIAQKLIKKAGVPIAAPSANISGKPSGTKVEDIIQELDGKIEYILDGGFTDIGLESTIIKISNNKIEILRPGKITKFQLEQVVKEVKIDKHVLEEVKESEIIASPGMKYRHYAPNTKCILVYSKNKERLINKINEITKELDKQNKKVLVFGKKQHINSYIAIKKWNMGQNLKEIAKNIFTLLRKIDKEGVDLVIIEGVGERGLGLAITNRLIKTCEYNYIVI